MAFASFTFSRRAGLKFHGVENHIVKKINYILAAASSSDTTALGVKNVS